MNLIAIKNRIEVLTSDEDLQNDLWVKVLEAQNPAILDAPIDALIKAQQCEHIRESLLGSLKDYPSDKLLEHLQSFSELERSVMFMLMLGFSNLQISQYKTISLVRLNQLISTIAIHPAWEIYLAEDKTNL